jgi:hypothetical protein
MPRPTRIETDAEKAGATEHSALIALARLLGRASARAWAVDTATRTDPGTQAKTDPGTAELAQTAAEEP